MASLAVTRASLLSVAAAPAGPFFSQKPSDERSQRSKRLNVLPVTWVSHSGPKPSSREQQSGDQGGNPSSRGIFKISGADVIRSRGEVAAKSASRAALSAFAAAILLHSGLPASALAAADVEIGAIFERSCSGCHAGGGNLLKPGAGLTQAELERNGLSSADDVFRVTYFGKDRMPGYGADCQPRAQCTFGPRLSDDIIRQLAEYTVEQAAKGWPSP